jgi:hypothetical protein
MTDGIIYSGSLAVEQRSQLYAQIGRRVFERRIDPGHQALVAGSCFDRGWQPRRALLDGVAERSRSRSVRSGIHAPSPGNRSGQGFRCDRRAAIAPDRRCRRCVRLQKDWRQTSPRSVPAGTNIRAPVHRRRCTAGPLRRSVRAGEGRRAHRTVCWRWVARCSRVRSACEAAWPRTRSSSRSVHRRSKPRCCTRAASLPDRAAVLRRRTAP